ncbi:unnamed protein product [Paramecium pentaurelia]|uniref:Tetratricopeptide repeat protein n=1 Tax=Paramecium pentaurelia TaxID=43138 RepID=A0A8S1U9H4_9CILI|nr:unnamed protein product [Paramecium pentaurelia]
MVIELTKNGDFIISGNLDLIKIQEYNYKSEDKNEYNIKEAERLLNQGVASYNLYKYKEAIECYDKAISINPKYDAAWSQKGYALHQLQKYNDAISCYDQALSIHINTLRLQRKGLKLIQIFG